jgi:uncharacterized protein
MEVRRLLDPARFLAAAGPFLLADEARHNLVLGLAGTLQERPDVYPEFRLWVVERAGDVVGAALQTPPYNLVLAQPSEDEAVPVLAEAIAADDITLPGVVAALPEADRFADAWEAQSNTRRRLRRSQRIYAVTHIRAPRATPGKARLATLRDRTLLVSWVQAFADEVETELPSPAADPERIVDARLNDERAGFMLWHDGQPVSLAGWGAPTPNGVRVGPVYTPPDRRSRGYASAVTAAASVRQLEAGKRFCFLYTDLANPTSNKIYMDIGYEPVCDAVDYAFERSSAAP